LKIQSGIAEMLAARFSEEEKTCGIEEALAEADGDFATGEGISIDEMRRRLGLV
jgi:hypothetical protein